MKQEPIHILVIVGPTATGKSDLAVRLAKERNGEVISADSRQVYKGLDIGTGKITVEEMYGIRHHLLDVADPRDTFTVLQFKTLAEQAIRDIVSRGKLPIICGGTGFYIDALINNVQFPLHASNQELRKELSNKSVTELTELLKQKDSKKLESMNDSDSKNPRRLVRAIELAIAREEGEQMSLSNDSTSGSLASKYQAEFIGLKADQASLKKRIHDRLIKRIDAGMIEEAEKLHAGGLSYERMEELGLEYRYLARFLQGTISKEDMIKSLDLEIGKYAKRQMTWFKRNGAIAWREI